MSDMLFAPVVESPLPQPSNDQRGASSTLEFSHDQLYSAMVTSSAIALPHNLMLELFRNPQISNRRRAIEWIRKVLGTESTDVRDTSVRIFDTYLAMSFWDNPQILNDTSFISFSAVASMILSSKLHSTTNYISPSSFSAFNTDDILFFERQIVLKTGSRMSTLASPAFFVDFVLSLCPDKVDKDQLLQMVNILIGEFWEDGASLLFAPSTIAISAVVVCLSLKKMDCSKLVDSLPEFLLPNRTYPFFLAEDGKSMYLDLNTCMKAMERLPYIRASYMTRSPTSVAEDVERN